MSDAAQTLLFDSASRPDKTESPGAYLVLDQDRLLDAAPCEWLIPRSGPWILRRGLPADWATASARAASAVALRVDLTRLPQLELALCRTGAWQPAAELDPTRLEGTAAITWPAPLPFFAIAEIGVPDARAAARLEATVRHFADLPPFEAPIRPVTGRGPVENLPPPPDLPVRVPDGAWDRGRGALALSLWALPRLPCWLDLWCSLFNPAGDPAPRASSLAAPWWLAPPWRSPAEAERVPALWRAACDVFTASDPRSGWIPAHALEGIVERAHEQDRGLDLEPFRRRTLELLRSERALEAENEADPLQRALQLVLLRAQPERYVTWAGTPHQLSPGSWWAGAALSGLLYGYAALPCELRGSPLARRWAALSTLGERSGWPSPPRRLSWSVAGERVRLAWGDELLDVRRATARHAWLSVRLEDPAVAEAALELARTLGLEAALAEELELRDCELALRGEGRLGLREGRLQAEGSVRLRLPAGLRSRTVLDEGAFRRLFTTAALPRDLPRPPGPPRADGRTFSSEIPGLVYLANWVDPAEEARLLAAVDAEPWLEDLSRRVQHYGWKYDYKARRLDDSMRLGALPSWAQELGERLHRLGLLPHVPDQLIVNEYVGRQGIAKHVDKACFADGIAMVSLGDAWEMVFRPKDEARKVHQPLARGSVVVLTGEARWRWTHEIPKRKTEQGRPRRRRVSLTFRKVLRRP